MAGGAHRKPPAAEAERVEPKHTPEATEQLGDNPPNYAPAEMNSGASSTEGATPEVPEKPLTPSAETQTSATGIVQTITTDVEPPGDLDADLSSVEDKTLVRVRPGRCAPHRVRADYVREGEEFLAEDAYNGIVGAREMLRKGILEVVTTKRAKSAETTDQ